MLKKREINLVHTNNLRRVFKVRRKLILVVKREILTKCNEVA